MKMSKEEDRKNVYNQIAWILNYQPKIEHQHIHWGSQGAEPEEQETEKTEAPEEPKEKLNLFAPTKSLKEMLRQEWFKNLRTSNGYNEQWTDDFVSALMASEHGAYIARLWTHPDKRLTIKGRLMGALSAAGVLKGSKLGIARAVLGISSYSRNNDDKKATSTFANYMGQSGKEPYAEWVKDYVDKASM